MRIIKTPFVDKTLICILLAAIVICIFFSSKSLIWDEAVYVGMGKYLYSGGTSGFFEILRPIALPLLVGFVWKLGLNVLAFSKIIELSFAIGYLYMIYLIGKKTYDKKTGLLALVLVGICPIFFLSSTKILTDIPAAFFVMVALYFFISKKYFLSGIMCSIAFLMRFPQGLIFPVLLLSIIITNLKSPKHLLKSLLMISTGFILIMLPYFLFNYFMFSTYGVLGIFLPLKEALWSQGNTAESVIKGTFFSYVYNLLYYILTPLKENPFFLFFIPGILSRRGKKHTALLVLLALYFSYHTIIINKQERFMFGFLPIISILSSHGFFVIEKRFNKKIKLIGAMVLSVFYIIFLLQMYKTNLGIDTSNQNVILSLANVYKTNNISAEIDASFPLIAAYVDNKIFPNYFSNSILIRDFEMNSNFTTLLYYPSNFCLQDDINCNSDINRTLKSLIQKYNPIFYDRLNGKDIYVFSKDFSIPPVNLSLVDSFNSVLLAKNPYGKSSMVVFVIDDVGSVDREGGKGDLWKKEEFSKLNRIFSQNKTSVTWNVIPNELTLLNNESKEYLLKIFNENKQISISQLGYEHIDNGHGSEFKGLPYTEQLNKIQKGKRVLQDFFRIEPKVFSPPFSSGDENTIKALKNQNYTVYSSLFWDTIYENFTRLDVDIRVVEVWNPPKVKSLDFLKKEFDNQLSYKHIIVISIPFFALTDFNEIEEFIKYLKEKDIFITSMSFAEEWYKYSNSLVLSLNENEIMVETQDTRFANLTTLLIFKEGNYMISGDSNFINVKNPNTFEIGTHINNLSYKIKPFEIVSVNISKI